MQQQIQSNGKVTSIGNRFVREAEQHQEDEQHHQFLKRVHYRRIFGLLLILAVVAIGFGSQIVHARQNNERLQAQVQVQNKKLTAVQQTRSDLKIQVKQLNNNTYLEKLIRYKYDYSKNGEIVFTLPEANSSINAKN